MIAAACLALVACAAFAATMQRTGPKILGRQMPRRMEQRVRLVAWLLLGLSLVTALREPAWTVAFVEWIGDLAAAALVVAVTVSFAPRRLAWIVTAFVFAGTAAHLLR